MVEQFSSMKVFKLLLDDDLYLSDGSSKNAYLRKDEDIVSTGYSSDEDKDKNMVQ